MEIRRVNKADLDEVVLLNNKFYHFLGGRKRERDFFERYLEIDVFDASFEEKRLIGFLMGFGSHLLYPNPNYEWFKKRFDKFLYLDRAAIIDDKQRMGIGRNLYQNLFKYCNGRYPIIVGEIDVDNIDSLKFNEKMGFKIIDHFFDWNGKKNAAVIYHLNDKNI